MSLFKFKSKSAPEIKNPPCPVCGEVGEAVERITVQHIIQSEWLNPSGDGDYFLCLNPDCEVAYYQYGSPDYYRQDQLSVPLWYKTGAQPKYACYCAHVTEDQVVAAVRDGAQNLGDVIRVTGAMNHSNCRLNNPSGKCCSRVIQSIINKTWIAD